MHVTYRFNKGIWTTQWKHVPRSDSASVRSPGRRRIMGSGRFNAEDLRIQFEQNNPGWTLEHNFALLQSFWMTATVFFVLNSSGNDDRNSVASRGFQLHLRCIPKNLRPGLTWASTGLKPVFQNFKKIKLNIFMAKSPSFVLEQPGVHQEHLGTLVRWFSLPFHWFCRSFGRRLEISRRCKETRLFQGSCLLASLSGTANHTYPPVHSHTHPHPPAHAHMSQLCGTHPTKMLVQAVYHNMMNIPCL